jgi:hypothetical protein
LTPTIDQPQKMQKNCKNQLKKIAKTHKNCSPKRTKIVAKMHKNCKNGNFFARTEKREKN